MEAARAQGVETFELRLLPRLREAELRDCLDDVRIGRALQRELSAGDPFSD